jgi:hypothetical protein
MQEVRAIAGAFERTRVGRKRAVLYIDGLYGFDEPLLSSERRVRHWESSGTSKVCVVFGRLMSIFRLAMALEKVSGRDVN